MGSLIVRLIPLSEANDADRNDEDESDLRLVLARVDLSIWDKRKCHVCMCKRA